MADTTEEAAEPFVPQAVPDLVIPQLLANDDEENFEGKLFNNPFEIAALIIGVVYSGLNVINSPFLS